LATRRLDHADGTFSGVAIAPISLQYFARTYAHVDVGRSGSITLLAENGTIMFRKPRSFIGRRMTDAGMFAPAYKSRPAGWFIRSSHVDGIRRLFAFRRLHNYPLIVQVAFAESDYLADWETATRTSAVVVFFIILTVCGLAGVLDIQIGRRKRAEDTLARLALLDGLTGLANRRQFDTMLEREWRRGARDGTALAVLMIDVDNFKSYNDLYGHQLGDKALQTIAQTIAANVMRPTDIAARYGGEEFVVILPGTDLSSAMTVAERIRTAVIDSALAHQGAPSGLASVSIGVAGTVPPSIGARCALVEAADRALYDAKRTGRNRISVSPCAPGAANA
jgi:diguanylate cyclase (GGDEF)-like protein